jgi:hypothetical protein
MLAGYRSAYSRFDDLQAILATFSELESTSMFTLYVYPAIVGAHLKSTLRLSEQDPAIATRAQDTIQCLLAIMLYYCQPSLFSSTLSMYLSESSSSNSQVSTEERNKLRAFAQEFLVRVPPDTKVRQAVRRYQLVVGKATLLAYIVLCGSALLACLIALCWAEWWTRKEKIHIPRIGPFPAWDEWVMCEIQRGNADDDTPAGSGNSIVKAAEKMKITLERQESGLDC